MSTNYSAVNNPSGYPVRPGDSSHPVKTVVDLNNILQQALQRHGPAIRTHKLVLRCQALPRVEGDPVRLLRLFEGLLEAILSQTPKGSRFLLHVDCGEERDPVVIDLSLAPGQLRYCIQFHTNITVTEEWKAMHGQFIADSMTLIAQQNGSFKVNEIKNTGCLFSISLPGTLN
jgi:hypothetical protein